MPQSLLSCLKPRKLHAALKHTKKNLIQNSTAASGMFQWPKWLDYGKPLFTAKFYQLELSSLQAQKDAIFG